MQQLAHLAQNSLKFLQAGEDKDCHFFSALGGKETYQNTEKRKAKVEKARKCHGSLCCIYCMPCEGLQRRLDLVKASTQRHAQVHAELAPDAVKLFSTPHYQLLHINLSAAHRNLRNSSTQALIRRIWVRAHFDMARFELAGGQLL